MPLAKVSSGLPTNTGAIESTKCDKQLCCIASGRDRHPLWFAEVFKIPMNLGQVANKIIDFMITIEYRSRRSVGGRDLHSKMTRWTQKHEFQH